MNMLTDVNDAQEIIAELYSFVVESKVELQKGAHHNMLKTFKCPQCGSVFDRASQLSYHYRSIHLGERSQVCKICGKGFFRKADLRTHLNIHMGTSVCICEVCGRQFNHISNLIRHCRMHKGVKPYLCSICDRRFTQVSSLVRHKRVIHGIPKETMHQYCSTSLTNNKSQINDHASKENKTINDNIKDRCHDKICMEPRCQDTERTVQKDKIVSNQCSTNTDNKAACLPLETVVYVASEQFEGSNLAEIENINHLSQDYLVGIEEKLGSTDLPMDKTTISNSSQNIVNNHEQIQSKDNIIYLHHHDNNSFTFLPRDRGPNIESQTQNDENILRSSDSGSCVSRDFKEVSTSDVKGSLNVEADLHACNSDEVSIDQKFLYKQIYKEIISENRKCEKQLNDDNQLYVELSDLGLLKFDESRCNNTDSNLSHTAKSQYSASIGNCGNDLIYAPTIIQDQDILTHNEENPENLNSSNIVLNNEEPLLRLVQTETGEQFYELMISDLVEKMQNTSCTENLEDKMEEPSNTFRHCEAVGPNLQENNEKNDQTDHQQTLEDLADINNEFNYTQFDFHREDRNFIIHNESNEHFQQRSRDEYTSSIQEKNLQAYNSENLELLENESHVDFDKYVETNLEVFERLNYENCNEKFFEFVEVADIGIESSGCKESSMVCLIQNDGEQLLELLQDSQIAEQEPNQDFILANNLDENCSNALHDNNKIANCPEGKSDFFAYEENNVLEKDINSDKSAIENNIAKNNERHVDSNNYLYILNNLMTNENMNNENCVRTSEEPKKMKASPKKFQCSVCKKAFSTAYNYKQHIGIHFTDQQKFHCKECRLSFAWKSTLNKHIASNHSSEGPQKFVCDICPKVYSTLSQVNEHVKRDHLKQRNHVCLYCGKSFFKSFDLKTHSRTHTNERPYVCRVCGKRFHHQSHIIRHERTHSGERPYVCDICQKTFMQPSSLKAHMQKHRQIGMDILDYQMDEDDPITLATL